MCTYFWLWRMVMSWWLKIEISVCVVVILSKCFFSNNFSLPVISIRIGTQIDYTWINLSICFSFPQTTSMLQSLLKLESSVIPPQILHLLQFSFRSLIHSRLYSWLDTLGWSRLLLIMSKGQDHPWDYTKIHLYFISKPIELNSCPRFIAGIFR